LSIGYLNNDGTPGFYLNGSIDEVALYDRALPKEEIDEHYAAGLEGKGIGSLNPAPVADAGSPQADVESGSAVTLDGSNSTSGDDGETITAYLWEQTDGTTVQLSDADTATATFTAPDVESSETLTFQLTVTNSANETGTDTTTVTVVPATTDSGGGDDDSGCFINALF
jgi:hypothetical protein